MSTFAVFLFVIVQRASVPWFLQLAKVDGAYPFSANSIVVSVAFVEILLGVGVACGTCGFREGLRRTVLSWKDVRVWWTLGISQAMGDMLELYANKYLDASTYQVMLQSKLLVTALLIALVTNRGVKQSSLEWLLLSALSLGLTTYSILSSGSGTFSTVGTCLAVLKVILSCVNAVFTERILKQSENVPLVHQIVHMKVFWCLWSVVFMGALEGPSVFAPSTFFQGWGVSVLLVMATYVVKNWSGTFLLKRLDSLLKNIAEAFSMLVLYLLEISPAGVMLKGAKKELELPTFFVTMMVVLLVWAYLESKKASRESEAGKKISITELLGTPLVHDGSETPPWMRNSRRLGKRYGLLPTSTLGKLPPKRLTHRLVANKNADPDHQTPVSRHAASQLSLAGASREPTSDNLPPLDLEDEEMQPVDLLELGKPPLAGDGTTSSGGQSLSRRAGDSNEAASTFGLLDTIQGLLQSALDDDGQGGAVMENVQRALAMCKGLRPYMEAVSSPVSPECQAVAAATNETDWSELHRTGQTKELYHPGMMTSAVQGHLIGFFCSMLSAQRCLEIGSFTGFSTLCMAEATRDKVIAIEFDPYLIQFSRRFFDKSPHGHKIEVKAGDALEILESFDTAVDDAHRFGLIFIDGEKTQYAQYFKLIIDKDLLAPGGLICIDETLWKGSVYAQAQGCCSQGDAADGRVADAMRELNQVIKGDPRLVSVLLPVRNGLTLVRRVDDHHAAGERDTFGGELLSFAQQQRPQASALPRYSRAPPPWPKAATGLASALPGDYARRASDDDDEELSDLISEDLDAPVLPHRLHRLETC